MAQLTVAENKQTQVARPLNVLAPLIKKDLDDMEGAKERAAEPYHERIAEKMVEARSQCSYSEFVSWSHRHFGLKETQTKRYLSLGKEITSYAPGEAPSYSSVRQYERESRGYDATYPRTAKREWHEPVAQTIERTRKEQARIAEEHLNKQKERDEQRKLALRLIDIGYRVLSKELHPDRGGSRAAMQRLVQVRDRLKQSA